PRKTLTVVRTSAVSEAIGILSFFVIRHTTRRNCFFPCRLLHRVGDILVSIRLMAADIVFRLVPIALERGLHALPRGLVLCIPPFWIFSHGTILRPYFFKLHRVEPSLLFPEDTKRSRGGAVTT